MSTPINLVITEEWLQQNIEIDKNYIEYQKAYNELYPEDTRVNIAFTLPLEICDTTSQIKDVSGNGLEENIVIASLDCHLMYERYFSSTINEKEELRLAEMLELPVSSLNKYKVYKLDNNGEYSIYNTKFKLVFNEDAKHKFKLI